MRTDPKKDMHVRNVRKTNAAWRDAKANAHIRAKIIAAQEIAGYQAAMDHEIRLALEAGVSKTRIREEGMLTKNQQTLLDSLHRTDAAARELKEQLEADPLADRYSWFVEAEELRITLTGHVFAAAAEDQDWDTSYHAAELTGLASAQFRVQARTDGSLYLVPLTPDFMPEYAKRHPVVVWASQPANEAEAIKWYAEQVAA